MDCFEESKEKSIDNIISIIKLASLLFCSIIIYNRFFIRNNVVSITESGYFNITAFGLSVCVAGGVYFIWSFFNVKIFKYKYIKTVQLIENFVFIGLFTSLLILSKPYACEYKYLFLLIIIASTLQSGMKSGLTVAGLSSLIILLIDLRYKPSSGINTYFENDLIVAGVYLLTAWPLGHYVKIENEKSERKDIKLKELSDKVDEQYKKRKHMEKMLLKNESCYNLLIENSRDAIFVHRYGKIIFANESAIKMLGFKDSKGIYGVLIHSFIPDSERKYTRAILEKIYTNKKSKFVFEQKIMNLNKEITTVQNTSTYFIYEGEPTILSIIHDITSEREVQKLKKDVEKNIELLNESRELNRLITEFLSNIAHELKTPLNVIFSAIQVIGLYKNYTKEEFVNKQDKYLKIMKQNCYRLTRLINNLLDMSKLDSGFLKLNTYNRNIVTLVEDITSSVAPYVESKNINLIFDTDVEERIIAVDPEKIERIILNLLSNAIKFTDSYGQIYINITNDEDYVLISVKDTGIGIPKDKLEMIFERFGQVNKSFRRNCEGSGIGLYLVKSFVELHGGKINIESNLGFGSNFTIQLPAVTVAEEYKGDSIYEANTEKVNMEFSDIYFDVT